MLGNVAFSVIPMGVWVWYLPKTRYETAILSCSSAIMALDEYRRWKTWKCIAIAICYLPFWKYSQSHKQEHRELKQRARTAALMRAFQNNRLDYIILHVHAFPLCAIVHQRCTILTKDTQKIKRVPNSVSGTPKKAHGRPKDSCMQNPGEITACGNATTWLTGHWRTIF